MIYRIKIADQQMRLTEEQYSALEDAINMHANSGYRDGETRLDGVVITECGETFTS